MLKTFAFINNLFFMFEELREDRRRRRDGARQSE